MKFRAMILLACVGLILSAGVFQYGWAASGSAEANSKIGVVSVRRIFDECSRIERLQQQVLAERDQLQAELGKLSADIDSDKAGLKTLKPGRGSLIKTLAKVTSPLFVATKR